MTAPICSTICGSQTPAASVVAAQLLNDDADGQSIPSGASTPVLLPDIGFEIGNIDVDTATGEIVILESGLYELTFYGAWLPNGADGFVALSLLAPPGTTFPLAPAAGFVLAAQAFLFAQDGTTFALLTAGEHYGLVATQVSGSPRTLTSPMLTIARV